MDAGVVFEFRKGNDTATAASTRGSATVNTDGNRHTYTVYATVADNAYEDCDELIPYVGWLGSEAAGAIRISGITVRRVGNQWNNTADTLGFAAADTTSTYVGEVACDDAPIAYEKTVKLAHLGTAYTLSRNLPVSSFPQPGATDTWTLSFWAKLDGSGSFHKNNGGGIPQGMALTGDGTWHYYVVPVTLAEGKTLADASLYVSVNAQSTLYLNGVALVPGDVALAHESGQNSAVLKNITRTLGNTATAKHFNTAIEYDTDAARTAYSRIKYYINQGDAISYEYDDAGNISKITNPDGSYVTYTYDALNQLLSEEYSSAVNLPRPMYGSSMDGVGISKITYTYDARGNMLRKVYTWSGGDIDYPETMTYADTVWNDRVTKIGNTTISYDEIGNPLNWTDNAVLTWQHGRQLSSFTRGNTAVSYVYNDEGIRTSKTVNGVTTNYNILDGGLRSMSDGTNTLQFFENSVYFNNVEYWYVYNAQNDVIGLIDNTGEYVVRYTYSAYGLPLSKTGSMADTLGALNPYRYRGYIYDEETGLYYVSSRYYDPAIGRWLNSDNVVAGVGHSVQGCNLFAYCLNNPVNMADNTGELPFFLLTAAIGAVTGAVIGGVRAARNGGNVWKGIGVGAAAGALIGAGLGLVAGAALAGSIVASTTKVAIGAVALANTVASAGIVAGTAMLADNISQAISQAPQVFWAGGEATKNVARQFACNMGGKTLDMTHLGAYLEKISASEVAWRAASTNFANVASNACSSVYSIQSAAGVNLSSMWGTVEYALLQDCQVIYGVLLENGLIRMMS